MKREAGLLFPISSLWGKYGIGTLGKSAYEFIDFLKESELKIWQILPLNVTSFGNSPYQSPSNYALNYNFIDFDTLIEKELLRREEVENEYWGDNETRINYGALFNNKLKGQSLATIDKPMEQYIMNEMNYRIDVIKPIIEQISKAINDEEQLYLQGANKTFENPEFESSDFARKFMNLLEFLEY